MFKSKIVFILPLIFIITACHSQKAAYERISEHYVYQKASYESDPNFQTNIHASTKLAIPFFKQFYDLGIEDKKNNITNEDHQKRIAYFSSEAFINSLDEREQFISEKVHVETKRGADKPQIEKKIMADSIIEAYQAGYDGIQ